jgi:hypothetical protein
MGNFNIKTWQVLDGLFQFEFDNQYELTSTMMRLQEFYESPYKGIRGEYFTLEDYMDVYAKNFGNFTYTSDWIGFNVPGHIVEKFLEVYSGKLLTKEEHFVDALHGILNEHNYPKRFYVIASPAPNSDLGKDVLAHETAHGLYYLNREYKMEMNEVLDNINVRTFKNISKVLLDKGYAKPLVRDEMQAYFSTSEMVQLESVLKCKKIFNKYKPKPIDPSQKHTVLSY